MLSDHKELRKFTFSDFSGGMRRNVDPTRLEDTEYPILINGRSRYGSIRPIKLPQLQAGLPASGNFQGCYTNQNLAFVFVDGLAYIRDYSISGSTFSKVQNYFLDAVVDYIYAENVPDSFYNFNRVPISQETTTVISDGIDYTVEGVSLSYAGMVVQDGLNTPWLIRKDGVAKRLQRFIDWKVDGNREYVPRGLNMLYHDGILYLVSPDRKTIYRSVTGRPIDFVIGITKDGDKITDTLFTEEAQRMAHNVSNSDIIALAKLNLTPDYQNSGSPFMVSTTTGTYKVTPNFSDMLFGEPKLKNSDLFPTAILNQFSFSPTKRNDIDFIDETGLRSFNAINEDVSNARDDALSGPIFKLFEGITQTYTCCTFFDNYTFFAVNTIYGPGILIFDNLLGKFAALDIFNDIGFVKQFCQTTVNGVKRLFFITTNGGFYEYFGSSVTANCQLYIKEVAEQDAEINMKLERVKFTLQDIEETGILSATSFVNRKQDLTLSKTVTKNLEQDGIPIEVPFGNNEEDTTTNVTIKFQNSKQADKVGLLVEFNFMADLQAIQIDTKPIASVVDLKQQAELYRR